LPAAFDSSTSTVCNRLIVKDQHLEVLLSILKSIRNNTQLGVGKMTLYCNHCNLEDIVVVRWNDWCGVLIHHLPYDLFCITGGGL